MTTAVRSLAGATAAGLSAGAVLTIVELAFADDLAHADSATVGVAAVGLAYTFHRATTGDSAAAATYWVIAATAMLPAVIAHWGRRKIHAARQFGIRQGRVAERDYTREHGGPGPDAEEL